MRLASIVALGLLICVGTPVLAQQSGKQDYLGNCAGCHGADGKGSGPTVRVVPRMNPPDLTLLSRRHSGVFPFQEVEDTIDGRKQIPSHERFDMPFWGVTMQQGGKEFTPNSEAMVKRRIDAVVTYVESLQQK